MLNRFPPRRGPQSSMHPHASARALELRPEPTPRPLPRELERARQGALSRLSQVAPEDFWFANLPGPGTRRAYKESVAQFFLDLNFRTLEALGAIDVPHVVAWRESLVAQGKSASTVHARLSARSSPCR